MSDLIPAPRARARITPDLVRTLETLATLTILILTVGILYVARDILVPIAIAILLSFVLSPLVKLLRHIKIGKAMSVVIVVLSAFLLSVGIGVVIAKQISDLAADAPKYQATVTHKIEGARRLIVESPLLRRLNIAIADVSKMSPPSGGGNTADQPPATSPSLGDSGLVNGSPRVPVAVSVIEPSPGLFDLVQKVAGTAAAPVATAAFVAIFIVFILMQREDLRNRFIRLVGSGDIQRTTLAMNDAARRLSRYFLAQMLLNTSFGFVVAGSLTMMGVPSAVLCGSVTILMRFIPYIGTIGAVILPLLFAAAAAPGWDLVIETALLFVVLESVVGQIVEPLVYGHNTGISPIAVVLSATFWTWLWGPVGLVLSTPLTVCLVVVGRHVERLAFLDVILGDAPALTPVESFYQRILAGDASEITDHAESYLKDHTLTEYCDNVALGALLLAQTDVRRGRLEGGRLALVKETIGALMEDLFDHEADKPDAHFALEPSDQPIASLDGGQASLVRVRLEEPAAPLAIDPTWQQNAAVLCVAGRSALDEAAADILADLLRKRGIGAEAEPPTIQSASGGARHGDAGTKLIVLSFLDAEVSVAHARLAVRRLRRRFPGVPVVAGLWMDDADQGRKASLRADVKSDGCVCSLADAVALCLERARIGVADLAA